MIDLKELVWAAGFLEGEGSFVWHGRTGRYESNCYFVSAAQNERWPLERLQKLFGGSILKGNGVNKKIQRWQTSGTRARGTMMTLYSFLSPRRQSQISFALNHSWFQPGKHPNSHGALTGKQKQALEKGRLMRWSSSFAPPQLVGNRR